MARVLVVDDDPDIRLLLAMNLTAEGHQVQEAADGGEALAAVEADGEIDLVLLDLMMPGVSGWDVLRSLGQAELAPPVVVITAYSSEDGHHVGELLELGAVEVLAKPFVDRWLDRVEAVLSAGRREREARRARRAAQERGG